MTRSHPIRSAALGGVIVSIQERHRLGCSRASCGPILFVVLVIAGGVLYDGYSHASQKISELGGAGGEYAILQNLNFVMMGLLTLGFSWALARVLGPPCLGPALIGFFGLSASIANGLLPCDPGCRGETTVGLLHNITGLAGFIAAIVGMFVLARRWQNDPTWRSHAKFTRRLALVAMGGLAWFVVTQAVDAQSLAGVAQRLFAAALLLWIAGTAWKLFRQLEPDEPVMEVGGAAA